MIVFDFRQGIGILDTCVINASKAVIVSAGAIGNVDWTTDFRNLKFSLLNFRISPTSRSRRETGVSKGCRRRNDFYLDWVTGSCGIS